MPNNQPTPRLSLAAGLLAALVLPASAARAEPEAAPSPAPAEAVSAATSEGTADASLFAGWTGRLNATEETRVRGSGDSLAQPDEFDHRARGYISAGVTDPSERFAADAAVGLWWRLGRRGDGLAAAHDGVTPEPKPVEAGVTPERPREFWPDVYQLSAEYRGDARLQLARVGRQEAEHGRPATFDGASFELAVDPRVKLFAFGGRGVYFFSLDDDLLASLMGSVGAQWRPTETIKLELDYRLLDEDRELQDVQTHLTNHTYGLTAWWRPSDALRVRAWARGIDEDPAFVGAAARLEDFEQRMGVEARAEAQTVELGEIAQGENAYQLTLGKSLPHAIMRIDAWKGIATAKGTFEAHLGFQGRYLLDGEEEAFNRNFQRMYLQLTGQDVFAKGVFADVMLAQDRSKMVSGEGGFSVSGGAGYQTQRLRLEAGTYYQQFVYAYYQEPEERADVRALFASARFRLEEWMTLQVRYDHEIFDRRLNTLTASLTQSF